MTCDVYRNKASDRKLADTRRCLLNGRDVTLDTFYADTRRGVVRMYLRNSAGLFYLTPDGMCAKAERRGKVRLVRKSR